MPSAADKWRGLMGGVVVIVGLVVIVGVFAGTVWKFGNANEIVAIVGSVAGVVGTMVTAFFGIHATAAAGTDAATAAAYADPDRAGELADKLRGVQPAPESRTVPENRAVPAAGAEGETIRPAPSVEPAPEGGRR